MFSKASSSQGIGRRPEMETRPLGPLHSELAPESVQSEISWSRHHEREAEVMANAAAKLTLKPEDVVIAVMGITGTGKSTFINHLSKSGVKIGHNLTSCTTQVGIHPFSYAGGRTIYLLDTPGFDDTNRTDTQILEELAYFLGATYSKQIKLAGIIYLHRITDTRMGNSALRNISLFQALCGKESLSNVVLATTMWDKLTDPDSVSRGRQIENELRSEDGFWGDMVDCGSRMFRHNNTFSSALDIIDYLMSRRGPVVLAIQRQMIDEHRHLDETTAGQEVQKEILKVKQRYEAELKQVQDSMKAAIEAGDQKMADKLARMQEDYEAKIKKSDADTLQLKADFENIQKAKDAEYKKMIADLQAQSKKYQDEAIANLEDVRRVKTRQAETDKQLEHLRSESKEKQAQWQEDVKRREEEHKRQQDALEAEMQRMNQELMEKTQGNNSVGAFLGAITGALVTGVGVLTLNPLLVGAGGTMMAAGAASGAASQ